MSQRRYSVYRARWGGKNGDWLVLDNLLQYGVARCDSRSDARKVADALNEFEAAA